jgi:hypothetical protein
MFLKYDFLILLLFWACVLKLYYKNSKCIWYEHVDKVLTKFEKKTSHHASPGHEFSASSWNKMEKLFLLIFCNNIFGNLPRYMRKIGTEKFGSHIIRPRMTVNRGLRSRKIVNLQFYIQWNSVIANSVVSKHSVITNRFLGQIGHFVTQINRL